MVVERLPAVGRAAVGRVVVAGQAVAGSAVAAGSVAAGQERVAFAGVEVPTAIAIQETADPAVGMAHRTAAGMELAAHPHMESAEAALPQARIPDNHSRAQVVVRTVQSTNDRPDTVEDHMADRRLKMG